MSVWMTHPQPCRSWWQGPSRSLRSIRTYNLLCSWCKSGCRRPGSRIRRCLEPEEETWRSSDGGETKSHRRMTQKEADLSRKSVIWAPGWSPFLKCLIWFSNMCSKAAFQLLTVVMFLFNRSLYLKQKTHNFCPLPPQVFLSRSLYPAGQSHS